MRQTIEERQELVCLKYAICANTVSKRSVMLVVPARIQFLRRRPYYFSFCHDIFWISLVDHNNGPPTTFFFFSGRYTRRHCLECTVDSNSYRLDGKKMFLTVCLAPQYPENKPKAKQNNTMKGILFHLAPRRIENHAKTLQPARTSSSSLSPLSFNDGLSLLPTRILLSSPPG